MPYADLRKQREVQARWEREKCRKDPRHRKKRRAMKRQWFKTLQGVLANRASSQAARERANPNRHYERFNMRSSLDRNAYLAYVDDLRASGVKFHEMQRNGTRTVWYDKP